MRVLQVSAGPLSGAGAGGAERFCLELSRWLASTGNDVRVAAPAQEGDHAFSATIPLVPARWKPLRKLIFDYVSPDNTRRLRQAIDHVRPDVVHVHNIYGIGSQLVRVAAERVPTVVTLHDYWPVDLFVPRVTQGGLRYPRRQLIATPWLWAHRALHRNNLRGATLVSPSRYLARRLAEHGYRDLRVIPNGVELPEETAAGEARLLFAGRLVPEKGLAQVLPGLEPVAREFGWTIDVVGDGPLRGALERAHPSVRFYGRAHATTFYRQAAIVVLPSQWPENFPYVVLEAMAHALPVIASRVGGIPEIVEDGVSGILCDPNAPEQFAAAFRRLAGDVELRRRLGRAGREHIARELTWASIGPRYLDLYEELAPAAARPRSHAEVG